MSELVCIEATSRWDALALAGKLDRYHWFLMEPDASHWNVYVAVDSRDDELPPDLSNRISDWLEERHLDAAKLHTEHADLTVTRH